MHNMKMKRKSDGVDRVLKMRVHHPEEKLRELMSIRLTQFPRIYVDNLLYLHGRKRISMSMGNSEERKRSSRHRGKPRTCRLWKLIGEVTRSDERSGRGSWTKGRRRYSKLRGGDKAGQGWRGGGEERDGGWTAVTVVASVSQDGVALN